MTDIRINMKSVLKAAGDASCYDADLIIKAFDLAKSKGWTDGVISNTWMNNIHGWGSYNQKAIKTLIDKSVNWAGEYVSVPTEILDIFAVPSKPKKTRKTKSKVKVEQVEDTVTVTTSSTKSMNLRTLLHNCYVNNITDSTTALDILQKMKDSGYSIEDRDMDFAQGWKKFNEAAFKKMAQNTYEGSNGFAKKDLIDCPEFTSFLPLSKVNGNGKTLNVRTVLNKFYEKGCTDAIKIAATLQDLEIAGYKGVEDYRVPGLIYKTSDEVGTLIAEAHAGTGDFSGMELIADCPNF